MWQTIGFFYILLHIICVQGAQYEYLGCFNDKPSPNRALPYLIKSFLGNTPHSCARECAFRGYRYFGLQEGFECWCGNSGYDKYGVSYGCQYPCTGSLFKTCGGKHINSVYIVIDYTTERLTVPSSPFASRSSISQTTTTEADVSKKSDRIVSGRSEVLSVAAMAAVVVCSSIVLVVVLGVILVHYKKKKTII